MNALELNNTVVPSIGDLKEKENSKSVFELQQERQAQEKESITQEEKVKIEERIMEAIKDTHNEQVQNDNEDKIKKIEHEALKKTKNQLIEEFIQLQKTQNETLLYTAADLRKLKKNDIIKKLADYANSVFAGTVQTLYKTEVEPVAEIPASQIITEPKNEVQACKQVQDQNDVLKFDLIATGIYNLNLAMMSCLETGSYYLEDKTGGIAVLANLTKSVEQKREAFIVVFKQIYKDYKQELDVYLSPVAQYGILTMQVIAETVFKNVAEKKKKSEENTKK